MRRQKPLRRLEMMLVRGSSTKKKKKQQQHVYTTQRRLSFSPNTTSTEDDGDGNVESIIINHMDVDVVDEMMRADHHDSTYVQWCVSSPIPADAKPFYDGGSLFDPQPRRQQQRQRSMLCTASRTSTSSTAVMMKRRQDTHTINDRGASYAAVRGGGQQQRTMIRSCGGGVGACNTVPAVVNVVAASVPTTSPQIFSTNAEAAQPLSSSSPSMCVDACINTEDAQGTTSSSKEQLHMRRRHSASHTRTQHPVMSSRRRLSNASIHGDDNVDDSSCSSSSCREEAAEMMRMHVDYLISKSRRLERENLLLWWRNAHQRRTHSTSSSSSASSSSSMMEEVAEGRTNSSTHHTTNAYHSSIDDDNDHHHHGAATQSTSTTQMSVQQDARKPCSTTTSTPPSTSHRRGKGGADTALVATPRSVIASPRPPREHHRARVAENMIYARVDDHDDDVGGDDHHHDDDEAEGSIKVEHRPRRHASTNTSALVDQSSNTTTTTTTHVNHVVAATTSPTTTQKRCAGTTTVAPCSSPSPAKTIAMDRSTQAVAKMHASTATPPPPSPPLSSSSTLSTPPPHMRQPPSPAELRHASTHTSTLMMDEEHNKNDELDLRDAAVNASLTSSVMAAATRSTRNQQAQTCSAVDVQSQMEQSILSHSIQQQKQQRHASSSSLTLIELHTHHQYDEETVQRLRKYCWSLEKTRLQLLNAQQRMSVLLPSPHVSSILSTSLLPRPQQHGRRRRRKYFDAPFMDAEVDATLHEDDDDDDDGGEQHAVGAEEHDGGQDDDASLHTKIVVVDDGHGYVAKKVLHDASRVSVEMAAARSDVSLISPRTMRSTHTDDGSRDVVRSGPRWNPITSKPHHHVRHPSASWSEEQQQRGNLTNIMKGDDLTLATQGTMRTNTPVHDDEDVANDVGSSLDSSMNVPSTPSPIQRRRGEVAMRMQRHPPSSSSVDDAEHRQQQLVGSGVDASSIHGDVRPASVRTAERRHMMMDEFPNANRLPPPSQGQHHHHQQHHPRFALRQRSSANSVECSIITEREEDAPIIISLRNTAAANKHHRGPRFDVGIAQQQRRSSSRSESIVSVDVHARRSATAPPHPSSPLRGRLTEHNTSSRGEPSTVSTEAYRDAMMR